MMGNILKSTMYGKNIINQHQAKRPYGNYRTATGNGYGHTVANDNYEIICAANNILKMCNDKKFDNSLSKEERNKSIAEMYEHAGELFTSANSFLKSAQCFESSAVYFNSINEKPKAAQMYEKAGKEYLKPSKRDDDLHDENLNKAAKIYLASGYSFHAAKIYKILGIRCRDFKEFPQSISYLEKAVENFGSNNLDQSCRECKEELAKSLIMDKRPKIQKAFEIFEEIGCDLSGTSIGICYAKKCFFNALLCILARGQLAEALLKMDQYVTDDSMFDESRESRFIRKIMDSWNSGDNEQLVQAYNLYNTISKLEPWQQRLIRFIQKHVNEEAKNKSRLEQPPPVPPRSSKKYAHPLPSATKIGGNKSYVNSNVHNIYKSSVNAHAYNKSYQNAIASQQAAIAHYNGKNNGKNNGKKKKKKKKKLTFKDIKSEDLIYKFSFSKKKGLYERAFKRKKRTKIKTAENFDNRILNDFGHEHIRAQPCFNRKHPPQVQYAYNHGYQGYNGYYNGNYHHNNRNYHHHGNNYANGYHQGKHFHHGHNYSHHHGNVHNRHGKHAHYYNQGGQYNNNHHYKNNGLAKHHYGNVQVEQWIDENDYAHQMMFA